MNILLRLGRWAIANDWMRALVLKGLRAALIWLGPVVCAWLLRRGADASLANTFVSYVSGAILSGAGTAFSLYDAHSVRARLADAAIDRRLSAHAL